MRNSGKKIVIITTGQPSTNPRIVKEYQALKQEGYDVKVLYSFWARWALQKDEEIFQSVEFNKQDFILVAGNPFQNKTAYFLSRFLHKLFRNLVFLPLSIIKESAIARPAFFLLRTCQKYRADLYIAHYLGALPAAAKAGKKFNIPVIFDAEDFHSGELQPDSSHYSLAEAIENKYIPKVSRITASSELIADAYKKRFCQFEPVIIHNVFSKKYLQKNFHEYKKGDILKLFWVSQTVGAKRGIEDIIKAMGKVCVDNIECTLLGSCSDDIKEKLSALAAGRGLKNNQLIFMEPVSADEVFTVAAKHHVGLATETGRDENNKRALSNKLFSYLLSGLAVVASNTPAQLSFMQQFPSIGHYYESGNDMQLAEIFKRFLNEPEHLNDCRRNALNLAATELNWENESQKFLSVIESTLV